MKKDVREILNSFKQGLGAISETNKENVDAFMGLLNSGYKRRSFDYKD